MTLLLTFAFACIILVFAALVDGADKRGKRTRARVLCTFLNVGLWVGLGFWFVSAQRDGWQESPVWGGLAFAWAAAATLSVVWWLFLSTRGPAGAAPPPAVAQMATMTDRLPRINGKYTSTTPTVQRSRSIRNKYRRSQ